MRLTGRNVMQTHEMLCCYLKKIRLLKNIEFIDHHQRKLTKDLSEAID